VESVGWTMLGWKLTVWFNEYELSGNWWGWRAPAVLSSGSENGEQILETSSGGCWWCWSVAVKEIRGSDVEARCSEGWLLIKTSGCN